MASKTELNTIIKQRDQTIRSLTSLNNQLKNRLKDEIDKSAKLLKALNEGVAIINELQNKKWWEIWK